MFIGAKSGNEIADKILEYFQEKVDQVPVILGLIAKGESSISKYKFTQDSNESNFEQWLKDMVSRIY